VGRVEAAHMVSCPRPTGCFDRYRTGYRSLHWLLSVKSPETIMLAIRWWFNYCRHSIFKQDLQERANELANELGVDCRSAAKR